MGWTLQESERTECYYTYSLHGFARAKWIEKKLMGRHVGTSWTVWEEYLEQKKKNIVPNNGNGGNM